MSDGRRNQGQAGPIGVFDSGVGGLSVLRELRAALPHEPLIYVADSGHCPYGGRSARFIQDRSAAITDWLIGQGAKALVIACNTATAAAAPWLRSRYGLPIIGMEPAIKPAAAATRSGVVGVLATEGTAKSARLHRLIAEFGRDVQVLTQPCPGLVEQVEAGALDGAATAALVAGYVAPLLAQGADVLVLGCTHYPFLRPLIGAVAGPAVALIDTGAAVARHTAAVLAADGLLAPPSLAPAEFWTTGDLALGSAVMRRLWGAACEVQALAV